MSRSRCQVGPRFPRLGQLAYAAALPFLRSVGAAHRVFDLQSSFAQSRLVAARDKLLRGETICVLGLGCGGHNAGAGVVQASLGEGMRIVANHEEERFRAIKHFKRFPSHSLEVVGEQLQQLGLRFEDLDAVVASWDYVSFSAHMLRSMVEEAPAGFRLLRRAASPGMDAHDVSAAFQAPKHLGRQLGATGRVPIINLRHHDNHAFFSYGVSPFAGDEDPVMVAVLDGTGDDSSITLYVARGGRLERLYQNHSIFDSVGQMYAYISSTQGGWPPLSSEGRYMGAAAWGNGDRLTNPYYQELRQIFHFASGGRVLLNRQLAAWHQGGSLRPYQAGLAEILGPPIPLARMWNPDAILRVEDIEHAPITRDRVDKAAATQLVFEDAVFHVIDHLIRRTGSNKLVVTGGTALNCLANMRLLQRFDEAWYERYLDKKDTRLHLWIPPIPGDAGVPVGSAYHFACLAGASPGPPGDTLKHAFYCGLAPTNAEISRALQSVSQVGYRQLGNIYESRQLEQLSDLMAYIVSQDGVVGIYQGAAETGPRALGHRSILANPANPHTLRKLNELVKFREIIRPLAPMATLEAAQKWFELASGASDDNYNAYNYMVLTAPARPEAYRAIPAVIHHDGTSRVQIVREQIDPLTHAYLRAMGRYIGAEVSVNTSLNVGAPIAQTPIQALETVKKSRGMDGLFLVSADGDVTVAWHNVCAAPKDAGVRLQRWISQWAQGSRLETRKAA